MSADRLVEDMWGRSELPASPTRALQAKVSQLRRALAEAETGGRELVESLPSGYLLRTGADAVDARRFTELAARARETHDPRAKTALLSDALALWRGPAFADFGDEEFAQAAISRLEEQRLTVLEEQAEARLALGEHSLLADELGDVIAQHPLRERLRAAHVRALYRAGRQSEALDSYAELRERLAEELGLDPGPELVALHQAILEHDPALAAVPAPTTSAARPRTNLPAALTDLIGRSAAVADVRELLGSARLVTLTGPGGVGKTRLALAAAARSAESSPHDVWLVELAGMHRPSGRAVPASPTEVAEVVAGVVGIRDDTATGARPGAPPADLTRRLAEAMRSQELLLVLDNCEHVVEPVAELVALLLRSAPGLRMLATSREPLAVPGEVLVDVPPLELPGPAAPTDRRGPARVERGAAVRGPRRGRRAGLHARRRERRSGRDDLPAPRRTPAGTGAGRHPRQGAGCARPGRAAGRPVPPPDRRDARRACPAADAARGDRLELGAAPRARTRRAAPDGRERQRLPAGGRRGDLLRRPRGPRRRARRADQVGGPIAGRRRARPGRLPVPAARIHRGLRPRAAGGCRRAREHPTAPRRPPRRARRTGRAPSARPRPAPPAAAPRRRDRRPADRPRRCSRTRRRRPRPAPGQRDDLVLVPARAPPRGAPRPGRRTGHARRHRGGARQSHHLAGRVRPADRRRHRPGAAEPHGTRGL